MLNQSICTIDREEVFEVVQKVMIVDGDKQAFRSLQYALTSYGFHVVLCKSALVALLCSKLEQFDFIITGDEMPDMDGVELTRRLRGHLPLTIIIGMSRTDRGEVFLRAGANDFIQKPFVPYRLAMMIDGGDILA